MSLSYDLPEINLVRRLTALILLRRRCKIDNKSCERKVSVEPTFPSIIQQISAKQIEACCSPVSWVYLRVWRAGKSINTEGFMEIQFRY